MNTSRLEFHRFWGNFTAVCVQIALGQILFLQVQWQHEDLGPEDFVLTGGMLTLAALALRYFIGLRRRLIEAEQLLALRAEWLNRYRQELKP